jgi:hypothetical protein
MVTRLAEAQPQGFRVGMLMLDAREPYVADPVTPRRSSSLSCTVWCRRHGGGYRDRRCEVCGRPL